MTEERAQGAGAKGLPVPDDEGLKSRLRDMVESGALRIAGARNRHVVNVVTNQVFRPTPHGKAAAAGKKKGA